MNMEGKRIFKRAGIRGKVQAESLMNAKNHTAAWCKKRFLLAQVPTQSVGKGE